VEHLSTGTASTRRCGCRLSGKTVLRYDHDSLARNRQDAEHEDRHETPCLPGWCAGRCASSAPRCLAHCSLRLQARYRHRQRLDFRLAFWHESLDGDDRALDNAGADTVPSVLSTSHSG
jgi:hypothetical protein